MDKDELFSGGIRISESGRQLTGRMSVQDIEVYWGKTLNPSVIMWRAVSGRARSVKQQIKPVTNQIRRSSDLIR